MTKLKVLKRNDDCVLLQYIGSERYMVRDVENDAVYIGYDFDRAMEVCNSYSLDEVRRQRKELFSKWMKEFVEA